MITKWEADVREFMTKVAGQTVPTQPTLENYPFELRCALIEEEAREFRDACGGYANQHLPEPWCSMRPDQAEMIAAIVDLIYVAIGAAVAQGIELQPFWDEVHRSNMAKAGGRCDETGKLRKPPEWTPPDIAGVLRQQIDSESITGVYVRQPDGSYLRAEQGERD